MSVAETKRIIKESFNSITAEDWKKMYDLVIHVEENYKERDRITEDMVEIIMNVQESENSTSDSSFEVDFY